MNGLIIRERPSERESDVAYTWWRLPPQTELSLADGQRCILLYSGQPSGPAGPDVRDVVIRLLPRSPGEASCQLTGDVEFHVYASDWFVHGHQDDPRYNRVVLHVVHYLDGEEPTRRQDGQVVPICSLLDVLQIPRHRTSWPCQQTPLAPREITTTLLVSGLRRFAEKSQALAQALATIEVPPASPWSRYDTCLLPALAEGLGYGRDRAFFRAAGERLVGLHTPVPEPLGRAPEPSPLDARRLRTLRTLVTRWRETGAWPILRQIIEQERDVKATLTALQAAFHPLSRGRTAILVTNIVLPFAAMVATLENAVSLASRVHSIYLAYPRLVSNRVTRMMSTQLQLEAEPAQACLQQGLHAIYTWTCQAKDCQQCLCGGQRL